MSEVELRPVERIVRLFQDFAPKQSSGGILLSASLIAGVVGWLILRTATSPPAD
jgi:hypothetical protein